jgi:uracil-DNA glycosylase
VMGRIETYRGYDCIVLYHPSPAGRRWQQTRDQKKSITLVKKSISELRSRSSP